MKRHRVLRLLITLGALLALTVPAGIASADGTETLGPPSIPIAAGSGTVAAGTGLISKSGTISIAVPVGTIQQVLLYWEGHGDCGSLPLGDVNDCRLGENINVNSNAITGQLIGGPTYFYNTGSGNFWSLSYRADITGLGVVVPGANTVNLSGVSFDTLSTPGFSNGASVLVIYDDGSKADIGVFDGDDNAFINFAPSLNTTVPQTFTFTAENVQRTANLTLFVGSVKSPEYDPGGPRPTRITVTTGGITTSYDSVLTSGDGPTWDTLIRSVAIPAGATSLTVQVLSFNDGSGYLPASLSWVTAALTVPKTPTSTVGAGTPGFWMNHPDAWPVSSITIGGVTYTKTAAIEAMKKPAKKDMTYVMFAHLVAAELNVAVGTNASCITSTITDANAWMTAYPLGSGVAGDSAAWKTGEPLKNTLDSYNNGLLCAPSRDALK